MTVIPSRPCPPVSVALSGSHDQIIAGAVAKLASLRPALILAFTPEGTETCRLSAALSAAFGAEALILACSSAGGFSFGGYDDQKTIFIAFPAAHFQATAVWLEKLQQTPVMEWMRALRPLENFPAKAEFSNNFGLLLIDGASGREELVTATCEAVMPSLMVVGGSAADGLRFGRTHLAMNGQKRPVAALFCRVATDFNIEEIILDHFTPQGEKIVVTEADPENRTIRELNAEPAAEEYARIIGVQAEALNPAIFAAHPLIETQGGRHFVRAIRNLTPDGGIGLMSAVETGAILAIGRDGGLAASLAARLDPMPPADLVLGFDCILRRIAVEQAGEEARVADLYARHRVAGFATYGEQHGGIHVNQTFVGLAFRNADPHLATCEGEAGDAE